MCGGYEVLEMLYEFAGGHDFNGVSTVSGLGWLSDALWLQGS